MTGARRWGAGATLFAATLALIPSTLSAQRGTPAIVAGPQYRSGGLEQALLGSNWRVLWTTPMRVPILNLDTLGGLKPVRRGGRQSETLHFEAGNGHKYVFRSVDKFLHKEALPSDLRHTPAGNLVQDQISSYFPAAGLMVSPLQEAARVLHPPPRLVIMPDDARLGEYRDVFGGMLGQLEENPDEKAGDEPGFGGSRKIVSTENFYERIDESGKHRLDAREYLRARLIDFIAGDTDRGADNWEWARFTAGNSYLWVPIPRDRDFAFMYMNGRLAPVIRAIYPKIGTFRPRYDPLPTLTFMTVDMDRRLLVSLPLAAWDSIAADVQARLPDPFIDFAVASAPQEYQEHAAARIRDGLRARRDRIPQIVREFYALVSTEADIHASDEPERADIERLPDGSVEIRMYRNPAAVVDEEDSDDADADSAAAARPDTAAAASTDVTALTELIFVRRFLPAETREIRLYMHGGADHVFVSGAAQRSIKVRVIGGGGDDVLSDASSVPGAKSTVFYDQPSTVIARGPSTRVSFRPFDDLAPGRPKDLLEDELAEEGDESPEDAAGEEPKAGEEEERAEWIAQKFAPVLFRDFGRSFGLGPRVGHRSGVGILVGAGASWRRYGFRHQPYEHKMGLSLLYAPETSRFGIEFEGDFHPENTSRAYSLIASATQFESFRFHGFGNDAPRFPDRLARVRRNELLLQPSIYWSGAAWRFDIGPIVRYGKPDYESNSPFETVEPLGFESFGQVGGWWATQLERGAIGPGLRRGLILDLGGSVYPEAWDVAATFGEAHGLARAYFPVAGASGPFVALRAGGKRVWGDFPVHEGAFLGGRRALRGHQTDRFVGDASVFGSTELHVPLGRMVLLTRGELGIFGLADAGRVYFNGDSPGGFHTAFGGGVWFATLGHALSLTYAHGEQGRFYVQLGPPF